MSSTPPTAADAALKPPNPEYRRVATIGLSIIVITFGVLGIWAAVAPLNSAAVAPGILSVESNRQTVQHLEGGIVRKILVHEGDHVRAGQTLFQLDRVQSEASFKITKNQLFTALARRDRLIAERDGRPAVVFSPELTANAAEPDVTQAMADETRQFVQRRTTVQGQVAVLQTRIAELRIEIQGIDTERASMNEQVGFLNEEIAGLESLFKQDLVPKPRLLAVQRERSQLQGQIGRSLSDKARAEKSISETELQMQQLRQQFYQDVSKELADIETQSADLRQRFSVAQDQFRRVDVVAPMSGTAQNLRIFTEGAVARPGEPLVDIAPDHGRLIIQAHVSPNDIDGVHAGQVAEVRFPTFHSRTIPVMSGKIRTISQDRLVDEATHMPYYLSIIEVDEAKLPVEIQGKLKAGMPAEVIVPTGSRTALQYIMGPLTSALHKSMRER
jgi:HlyD family secretion protein/S-layer protein transport system membrane fusion protein